MSLSDCLVSYVGHSLGEGVLHFCRKAVGVFYNPSRLGKLLRGQWKHRPCKLFFYVISAWQPENKGEITVKQQMTIHFVERLQFVLALTIGIAETTCGIVVECDDSRWSSMFVESFFRWVRVHGCCSDAPGGSKNASAPSAFP